MDRIGSRWWLIGCGAAVILVVCAWVFFPVITLVVAISGAVFALGMCAGRTNAVGVGVTGALVLATLVPAGLLGVGQLSSIIGLILGSLWLLWFHGIFRRPFHSPIAFRIFALMMALDLVGSMMSGIWDGFSVAVAGFILLVGWSAGALAEKERKLVFRGLIALGLIEAVLCIYEAFIVKAALFAPKVYGINPFIPGAVRGQGTLGHPLVAGLVILIGTCLVLGSRMRIVPKVLLLAVLLIGNVSTGSSSLVVAAAAVIAFKLFGGGSVGARVAKTIVAIPVIGWLIFNPQIFAPVVQGITGQDSRHRINTLIAIPRLFELRSWQEAVFGSGMGSVPDLFSNNVMINDYFPAVDNQFVHELVTGGLVGTVLLAGLLTLVSARAKGQVWIVLAGMTVMFISFDVLAWAVTGSVYAVMLAQLRRGETKDAPRDSPRVHSSSSERAGAEAAF